MIEITDFGRFHAVEKEDDPILYFKTDDGLDWYDLQWGIARWSRTGKFLDSVYGAWVLVDDDGFVCGINKDPTKLAPHYHRVLGVDADPDEIKPMMTFDGKAFA